MKNYFKVTAIEKSPVKVKAFSERSCYKNVTK